MPIPANKRFNFFMDQDEHWMLTELAGVQRVSRATVLRQAVRIAYERLKVRKRAPTKGAK